MRASDTRGLFPGHFLSTAALAFATTIALCSAVEAKPKFVTFSVGDDTLPTGINAKGVVTGYDGAATSFVRQADGTIVMFSVPESTNTSAFAINKKGEITGYYDAVKNFKVVQHSFLRKADGSFKTFKVSGDSHGDFPIAINSSGTVMGKYEYKRLGFSGFIREKDGTITTVDCPSGRTAITAGNDFGATTGACNDGAFVRDPEGTFTFFDAGGGTHPTGINNEGFVTGWVEQDDDNMRGFIRAPDGTVTVFTVTQDDRTLPSAINSEGTVTGKYLDGGMYHGFTRASDGTITTFDPDGSQDTEPAAINDKGAVTGYYVDGGLIGFVRTP